MSKYLRRAIGGYDIDGQEFEEGLRQNGNAAQRGYFWGLRIPQPGIGDGVKAHKFSI